jgi:hypothetical protein
MTMLESPDKWPSPRHSDIHALALTRRSIAAASVFAG